MLRDREDRQTAVAYARAEGILLHAEALSTDGVQLAVPPVQTLPPGSPNAEVGTALFAMLDAHQRNYPHPRDWKTFSESFFKAAGLKSWGALHARSRCCTIERTSIVLRIVPTRNGGAAGDDRGFHALDDLTLELPSTSTPATLGAALISAFDLCQ